MCRPAREKIEKKFEKFVRELIFRKSKEKSWLRKLVRHRATARRTAGHSAGHSAGRAICWTAGCTSRCTARWKAGCIASCAAGYRKQQCRQDHRSACRSAANQPWRKAAWPTTMARSFAMAFEERVPTRDFVLVCPCGPRVQTSLIDSGFTPPPVSAASRSALAALLLQSFVDKFGANTRTRKLCTVALVAVFRL